MAAGNFEAAAAAFVSISDELPDDLLADDALFSAAQLFEEKLGNPAHAATLYARLISEYPDSRSALAAERRLDRLTKSLGSDNAGAAPLVRYDDILQRYGELGHGKSVQMMEEIVRDEPGWAGLVEAMLWLGRAHARTERYSAAKQWFLEAANRWPEGETGFDALYGAGQAAVHLGQFDEAEQHFRAMPIDADTSRQRSRDDALAWVERERLRDWLYTASCVVLALIVIGLFVSLRQTAGSMRASASALAHPPTEALYMIPVAGLMIAAALTGHHEIAPAVGIIVVGGIALTWLSGVGLEATQRRSTIRTVAHASALAVAIVALCYVAVHRTRLLDLIIATVRFGPDV